MPLTDIAARNSKPAEKVRKLSDGGGLQLWVQPSGVRSWYLAYRFEGKQRKMLIGRYPAISLSEARTNRDTAKNLLALGIDPANKQREDKRQHAERKAITFATLSAEVLEKKKREGRASATIGKREWLYSMASEAFGNRPIDEITRRDILDLLRTVETKGHLETARRLRSAIGEVLRFGISDGRVEADNTRDLRGAIASPRSKPRAAIIDTKGFGALLRAIDGYQGQPHTKAALQLLALLFPRPGELRQAEWSEFDFEARIWTVPATRAKMRREHKIPLPAAAIEILEGLKAIAHPLSPFVFPAISNPKRCMSENTMNAALRRLGYGQSEASAHGFRASASTLLNESGKFSSDAIERALAHQEKDAVRRAYARGEHWQERVAMMDWWSGHLATIR